jgi:hypothetical protein
MCGALGCPSGLFFLLGFVRFSHGLPLCSGAVVVVAPAVLRCSSLCQDHILRFSDASLGVHLLHWIEESSKKTNLAVLARLVEGLAPAAVEVREMEQQGDGGAEGPTHGCMQCKARQFYTVEELRNGNTLWRCAVCSGRVPAGCG